MTINFTPIKSFWSSPKYGIIIQEGQATKTIIIDGKLAQTNGWIIYYQGLVYSTHNFIGQALEAALNLLQKIQN